MISIISGPTCVGKSYFLKNKRERLLEIANLESDDEFEVVNWHALRFNECHECINTEIYLIPGLHLTAEVLDGRDKIICIHLNFMEIDKKKAGLSIIKKVNPVSAIILGVPYSEYKDRIFQRHDNFRNFKPPDIILDSNIEILDLYKEWIDELNKDKIPYVLVEAIGDYKVLEEEEFLRMLK